MAIAWSIRTSFDFRLAAFPLTRQADSDTLALFPSFGGVRGGSLALAKGAPPRQARPATPPGEGNFSQNRNRICPNHMDNCYKSTEAGSSILSINHHNVFGFKVIQKGRRLGANQDLGVLGGVVNQIGNNV